MQSQWAAYSELIAIYFIHPGNTETQKKITYCLIKCVTSLSTVQTTPSCDSIFLFVDWVTACLPIDPSSLTCSLASVSSLLGTPYNDSALPDLEPSLSSAETLNGYHVLLFSPGRLSLHNSQTFPEPVAAPRTQPPFWLSAAEYTKVVK